MIAVLQNNYVDTDGIVGGGRADGKTTSVNYNGVRRDDKLKLHLFGDDGARKTGMNSVEFSDDTFTLNTVGNSGDKGTGVFSKKYYSLGILLKASPDIRYGIYQQATLSMLSNQDNNWNEDLVGGKYLVLTTSGSKQKGNKTAKKDADGNYWMIGNSDSSLRGIFTVGIKEDNSLSNFRTKTLTKVADIGDGNTATTARLAREYPEILFVSDYQYEPINTVVWTCHHISNPNDCYYTCNYQGPCFQSDYADGSNKWIPFGMLDNALKSATFRFASGAVYSNAVVPASTDDAALAYRQQPNNEYFLNCYWDNIR